MNKPFFRLAVVESEKVVDAQEKSASLAALCLLAQSGQVWDLNPQIREMFFGDLSNAATALLSMLNDIVDTGRDAEEKINA